VGLLHKLGHVADESNGGVDSNADLYGYLQFVVSKSGVIIRPRKNN
jgi:hypothetical protein